MANKPLPSARFVIAVTHDLLRAEQFESYADLAEALKLKLLRLGEPYNGELVWNAIAHVQAVHQGHVLKKTVPSPPPPSVFKDFTPNEAKQIYRALMDRYEAEMRPPSQFGRDAIVPEFFPRLRAV